MANNPSSSSAMDETLKALLPLMNGEHEGINTSQLLHRLNILRSWFGEEVFSSSTTNILRNSTILELGCGQGDMTVTLAYYAKRVLAIDPAPLDYGSPMTLGQAQSMISQDKLVGSKIEWVNRDPIEFLKDLSDEVDFVVLAHSIFYMASHDYLLELFRSLSQFFSGKKTKVLIAEWGMRASVPAAEAHVLAARAQATNPKTDGNVRTLVLPEQIKELAGLAGWEMGKEVWIEAPDVADGKWEVGLARTMALEEKSIDAEARDFLEMERVVGQLGGVEDVRSMDVWTGVFAL